MHGQMASLKGIQHDSNWTFESTKLGSGVISENYLIATAMGATLSTTFSDSKYLGITYLFVPKGGNIEVRIDDGPQSVVSTDRKIAGVGYVILATNLPPGSHRLTIRVSSLPVMLFGILINPE